MTTDPTDDPLWIRAQEEIGAMPALRMQFFVSRINYVTVLSQDMLAVHSHLFDTLVSEHNESIFSLLRENPKLLTTDSPEAITQVREHIISGNKTHVAGYREWILNQALVSFCTFFDAFLVDAVELVLSSKVELLFDTKAASGVTYKKIIEDGLASTTEELVAKELGHFSFIAGIKSRIGYFESKLNVSTQAILDWDRFTDGSLFKHWTLDYLSEIYEKRNSIVHRDEYPIKTLEEIQEISTAFSKIIMNIALELKEGYSILLDVNRALLQAQRYQHYKSTESRGG